MKDELLKCPNCGSTEVTVSHLQRFMANGGDHYCHAVKTQDAYSEATCLDCQWIGGRGELVSNAKVSCAGTASG
jgi:hypothetical protein